MNRIILRISLLALAALYGGYSLAQGPVTYSISEGTEATDEPHVVVEFDDQELAGPSAWSVTIVAQRDFNGDGVMDALVSMSGGGNCCPDIYAFVTLRGGKVITAVFGDSDWAEFTVVEKNGQILVEQVTGSATNLYKFDGKSAIKVSEKLATVLATLVEINGIGGGYVGDETEKVLKADIDLDGKTDTITCGIWPRWGTLTGCGLPLPGGQTQTLEYACNRLGVLKTTRNGHREIVCDSDQVIYFEGKSWHTK